MPPTIVEILDDFGTQKTWSPWNFGWQMMCRNAGPKWPPHLGAQRNSWNSTHICCEFSAKFSPEKPMIGKLVLWFLLAILSHTMSRQVTAHQAKTEAAATCYGYDNVASTAPYVVGLQDTKSGWCRMRSAINPLLGCRAKLWTEIFLRHMQSWCWNIDTKLLITSTVIRS